MSAKRRLLVVQHDAAERENLVDYLTNRHGFVVVAAKTLGETDVAISAAETPFDAVLLDIGLPDGDSGDHCASLRRHGDRTTVVILTGPDSEAEAVRSLDAAAHDYITQPIRLDELLARLRSQWRLREERDETAFTLGPFTFSPAAKLLYDPTGCRRIPLTGKEVEILRFLVHSNGRPVARQTLLREVWGYKDGASTHTVETHIHRLRRKLEPNPRRPTLLVNENGGYRLRLPAPS
jgi:DNA-binding response OmpR family regulator